MKKIMTIALLLIAGALGWYYYGSAEKENLTQQAEKSIEENQLPIAAAKELPEPVIIEEQKPKDQPANPKAEEKKALTPNEQEEQILEKYRGQFASLQGEYSGRINALVGEAKAEYTALPKDTRSEAKYQLGMNYLQRGAALESECDARFSALLSQMKAELQSHNLSVSGVQTAQSEYESQKNSARSILLGKAAGE